VQGNVLKMWDIAATQALVMPRGSRAEITEVVFSPDGKHLAAGSYDHNAIIWDLSPDTLLLRWLAEGQQAHLNLSQIQQYGLEPLLNIHPDNEQKLLATRETWQIAAFADLYAQQLAQTGFPKKEDYERALRLYRACLSHNVDDEYFGQKIADLEYSWRKKTE
jgi:WD40 repeat protein